MRSVIGRLALATLLPVVVAILAAAAQGQYVSVQQGPSMYGHPQHTVEFNTGTVTASGERPASDFPQAKPKPLGDVARENREAKKTAKKAVRCWTNQ